MEKGSKRSNNKAKDVKYNIIKESKTIACTTAVMKLIIKKKCHANKSEIAGESRVRDRERTRIRTRRAGTMTKI